MSLQLSQVPGALGIPGVQRWYEEEAEATQPPTQEVPSPPDALLGTHGGWLLGWKLGS